MNKNIIVVGAMAVGLYLLSQANKPKKVVAKKKVSQKIIRGYNKPKIKKQPRGIAITSNKPKIKKAVAKRKAIHNKLKRRIVAAVKKAPQKTVRKPRRR